MTIAAADFIVSVSASPPLLVLSPTTSTLIYAGIDYLSG
jgi:hypothetical protein